MRGRYARRAERMSAVDMLSTCTNLKPDLNELHRPS